MTTNQPTFTGRYVDDIVKVLTASAVSGINAILIGAPGYGKTAIGRQAAAAMVGDAVSFARVDPSTPPEVIKGANDPGEFLNHGRLVRVTEGTAYDPKTRIAIIDELFRGSDVLFDAALDTLDRQDMDGAPPVWATANFVATGTRVEALIDRIGLWLWIKPGMVDIAQVAMAHLMGVKPILGHKVPTAEEMETIRQAVPGPKAQAAVIQALELLGQEAAKEGRLPHPRRIAQWVKILFSYSMYLTGDHDFDAIPPEALEIMRYAWPAVTAQEAAAWANIAGAAVDPVGTALNEALTEAFTEFKRVSQIRDSVARAQESTTLGKVSIKAQGILKALGSGDPRIAQAIKQIDAWFGEAIRGAEVKM